MNIFTVNEIKLKQYVLIAKAALSVLQSKEKNTPLRDEMMMKEFEAAVEAVRLPDTFASFDR